jgi:peptidyl-prolyl cis-trans isomerase C
MKNRFCLSVLIALSLFTSTLPIAGKASAQSSSQPLKIPDVVAKVNGVNIQSKYVEFKLNQISKNVKRPLTMRERTSLVKDLIEKEIVRELVNQQGEKKNLEVDSDLIEKGIAALRKPYDSDEDFEKAVSARGITLDDLKNSMKVKIYSQQLLNDQIKGKITIADTDVKKFYEDNKQKFVRPETFRTHHILAAIFPPDMLKSTPVAELQNKRIELRQKAEERIDAIIKELKEGADFEELAKTKSDDEASRKSGGDLNVIYKGVFPPSFDEAVSKLSPGEITGKVETPYGFHIIKLIEKRPSEQTPFDELKPSIQKLMYRKERKKLVEVYIDELRKQAKIETFFN